MKKKHPIWDETKSIFLSGFFTLLPLTITLIIFRAAYRMSRGWIEPIKKIEPQFLQKIPHSEFILVIIFIFIVGIILKFFVLKRLIHAIEESIFYRIPILRTIYSGAKQIVHGLTQQDQLSFNKVVLIEFPSKGIYSLGFLTGEFPKEILLKDEIYYSIFIPTTPNPTTGFFILVQKSEITEINLTKQEAMSIIISGGIVKPERFKQ